MADCIFCAIIAGEAPSTQVYEDERVLAFMDLFPGARGHCLVVPRAHARDLSDVPDDDLAACLHAARTLAGRAVSALGADGVNLYNCMGAAAGQTVFHFHVHVIPRYTGDGFRVPWPVVPADPETLAEVAAALRTG